MTGNKLTKLLVPPAKIASKLDWQKFNGAVLSLDIHKDRIGMVIGSHPTIDENTVVLEPIRFHLHGGKLPENAKQRLEEVIRQRKNICGVVVSWPLQRDTGHMGAPCGRTLHILEELLEETNVFAPNRPLCLWDSEHPTSCMEDRWGRCAEFARTSSKHTHLASVEQYNQDENVVAAQVWNDFVRVHWPTIHQQRGNYTLSDDSVSDDTCMEEELEPKMSFT